MPTFKVADAKKDEFDFLCEVTQYRSEDFNNPDEEFEAQTLPRCGFNRNDTMFCAYEAGDDFIIDSLDPALEAKAWSSNCHTSSRLDSFSGSLCSAYSQVLQVEEGLNFVRASMLLHNPQMSANIMNNDRCVAYSITAQFWNNQYESLDTASGYFGMMAGFLALIVYNLV